MKALLAALVALSCMSGCVFEDEQPRHGREAAYAPEHRHCEGCGHVQDHGVWYERH